MLLFVAENLHEDLIIYLPSRRPRELGSRCVADIKGSLLSYLVPLSKANDHGSDRVELILVELNTE